MLEDPIVKDQFLIGSDTVFDFGHRIFSPSDITCYVYDPATGSESRLTSGTDFSVGLKPETTDYSNGARVTLLTEQPAAGKLTVVRTVVPEQGVSLPNFGKIPSESLEAQLDRTIASVQQLHDTVQLAYKIPYGQSGTVTPEQSIKDMISSGGGGGGGGSVESCNYASSAGAVTNPERNNIINSALSNVSSGGTAFIATHLTEAAKSEIISSASGMYTGPFAVLGSQSPYGVFYNINGGYVYLYDSAYEISSSTGGSTPLSNGATVYLHFYSSGAGYTYQYESSAISSGQSGHYYTALARNLGGELVQYQYGDIYHFPPQGSGGGGGGATIETRSVGSSYTEATTGLLNAVVDMNNSSPGQALLLTVGGTIRSACIVPQSGGTAITSSYTCVISSGVSWSATSEINASNIQMYFIKF